MEGGLETIETINVGIGNDLYYTLCCFVLYIYRITWAVNMCITVVGMYYIFK